MFGKITKIYKFGRQNNKYKSVFSIYDTNTKQMQEKWTFFQEYVAGFSEDFKKIALPITATLFRTCTNIEYYINKGLSPLNHFLMLEGIFLGCNIFLQIKDQNLILLNPFERIAGFNFNYLLFDRFRIHYSITYFGKLILKSKLQFRIETTPINNDNFYLNLSFNYFVGTHTNIINENNSNHLNKLHLKIGQNLDSFFAQVDDTTNVRQIRSSSNSIMIQKTDVNNSLE